jgi:hypothetical protein
MFFLAFWFIDQFQRQSHMGRLQKITGLVVVSLWAMDAADATMSYAARQSGHWLGGGDYVYHNIRGMARQWFSEDAQSYDLPPDSLVESNHMRVPFINSRDPMRR